MIAKLDDGVEEHAILDHRAHPLTFACGIRKPAVAES